MPKIFIETERFILRELIREDVDGMFVLDADSEVHKYIGNNPILIKEQALDEIFFIQAHYQEYGIGRWAIIDKKTNDFIGWVGLEFITEETHGEKDYYDLGYRLIQKHWGKGIATETALSVLNYAFLTLGINEVFAMAEPENIASNRVLDKIGMKLVDLFEMEERKFNWYKIEKKDFNLSKKMNSTFY